MGIPRHMLAHHYHPHTCLHIKIYVTIHKDKIPADTQTWASCKETLEGITVSAVVGEVCCSISGELSPLSPWCLWYHIWLCPRCLRCRPSETLPAGLLPGPAIPGEVRWEVSAGRKRKRGETHHLDEDRERCFGPGAIYFWASLVPLKTSANPALQP